MKLNYTQSEKIAMQDILEYLESVRTACSLPETDESAQPLAQAIQVRYLVENISTEL